MAVLALDLGTKTGFAYRSESGVVISGTQNLTPKRFESSAMRFIRFIEFLDQMNGEHKLEHIGYEEVRRHVGTDAAHTYGGFMSHLLSWCEKNDVPCEAYPVGTIKKFWTGKGNASKDMMIQEAHDRGFVVTDDNAADALAILHMMIGDDEVLKPDKPEQPSVLD